MLCVFVLLFVSVNLRAHNRNDGTWLDQKTENDLTHVQVKQRIKQSIYTCI